MATAHDGRYAPSPSGELHLGNLRTALVAWCSARACGGTLLLRIDDLDPDRSREAFVESQLEDLRLLGIDWDGEPQRQSTRRARYADALRQLDQLGTTYPCFCSRADVRAAATAPHGSGNGPPAAAGCAGVPGELRYPGTCARLDTATAAARVAAGEPYCLRLRADGAVRGFDDALLGRVDAVVDDVVVRRRDGVAAYNLATTVDDHDAAITELVRGADLAPSTAVQLLLAELLDLAAPTRFAHVPLVLGPDGARLAKRHGAASLGELAQRGITVDRVRALLAVSIGIDVAGELLGDLSDLPATFDLARVPRGAVRIDPDALALGAGWRDIVVDTSNDPDR